MDPIPDSKTTVHFDNMLIMKQLAQEIIPTGLVLFESARGPYYKNHRVDIHVFNQLTSNYKLEGPTKIPCQTPSCSKNN